MNSRTTAALEVLDWLRENGFTPRDDSGPHEQWFDQGPVRVVVAGTGPEVDEYLVYRFTDDPAMLLVWSASFSGNAPAAVVAAAAKAAVDDRPLQPRTYDSPLGRVTIPDEED